MASATPRLKNTLVFAALAPAASVVLVHNLNDGAKALAPDIIFLPNENLTVTASTDASVTVQNDGDAELSGAILVEAWHTIERAFGDKANVDLTVKPFIVHSDAGDAAQIRNPMALPEQWIAEAVETDAEGDMAQQVSKNFDSIAAIRPGSIVGICLRVPTALGGGNANVTPTINGVPVGVGLIATLGAGQSSSRQIAVPGAIPYVAGDLIGVHYSTDVNFGPTQDIEAWLEVYEAV